MVGGAALQVPLWTFFGLVMVLCWLGGGLNEAATGVVEAPMGKIRQHPETDSA